MGVLGVNYDGIGWNADYVSTLNEDEFVETFQNRFSHIANINEQIMAAQQAYAFIISEYKKAHPEFVEKPNVSDDEK